MEHVRQGSVYEYLEEPLMSGDGGVAAHGRGSGDACPHELGSVDGELQAASWTWKFSFTSLSQAPGSWTSWWPSSSWQHCQVH